MTDGEIWQFVLTKLEIGQNAALLAVCSSSGSSPGRAGYKMAVAADGELCGSIGGGVMEVALVEQARAMLAAGVSEQGGIVEQVHRKDAANASGMICSGRQSVIIKPLTPRDAAAVAAAADAANGELTLIVTADTFTVEPAADGSHIDMQRTEDGGFRYAERLAVRPRLYIIGGGHCALALSEIASRIGFRVGIFDDRPGLNTIEKNRFADEIALIGDYADIGRYVPAGGDVYVVVMTLGYASDAIVIRQLIDHDIKYFGVLGSKAKMATLMKELRNDGIDAARLRLIRTPIGLPINSRTPDEIAVSIAAEMIKVRNS